MLLSSTPLHIPDGFLSPWVALVGWLLAGILLGIAVRKTQRNLGERQVPLMGVLAAFVFAAQAINFPILAGTSGHLLGGALVAILLGPWAASLVMTSVVVLQAVLFQDGGLLVMGWNIFNMGIITAFVGYTTFRLVRKAFKDPRFGSLVGAFTGAWLSVVVSAMATAIELAASATFPLQLGLPAMSGIHALIGLGEAVITTATVAFLASVRPALLQPERARKQDRSIGIVVVGLAASLVVALLSPLASSAPDGLEAVAERGGFADLALPPSFTLVPDYALPLISNPVWATVLAVLLGTLVVFFVGLVLGRLLASPSRA